ncbi:MAG: transcriptional regulator, partial [Chitinophagaceae bacterium]
MEKIKYKIITTIEQYKDYCDALEELVFSGSKNENTQDEIDLLTLLIEKWDEEQIAAIDIDPIQLLHSFLKDHSLKSKDLVTILGISKGYVSDILHYKK